MSATPTINRHLLNAQIGDIVGYNSSQGTRPAEIIGIDDLNVTIKTGNTDKSIKNFPLNVGTDTIRSNASKAKREPGYLRHTGRSGHCLACRTLGMPEDGTCSIDGILATVEQQSCLTLAPPETMSDDELAGVVIGMFGKMREYLPYLQALKSRFDEGDRDSLNRLRVPIRGCHSWKEFCTSILQRTPQALTKLMQNKKPKLESASATSLAEYEQEHPNIRQLAENFLKQMTSDDAIGALVGQDVPQSIAEAIVHSITEPPSVEKSYESILDVLPVIRAGKEIVPPSQYGVAEIEESVTVFTSRLVSQLQSVSDKKIVYRSIIRKFEDLLQELA